MRSLLPEAFVLQFWSLRYIFVCEHHQPFYLRQTTKGIPLVRGMPLNGYKIQQVLWIEIPGGYVLAVSFSFLQ